MDESLISAIERYESLADSFGSVSEDRSKALDYYLGNPMGNEMEGRSKVISRDTWDAVEWIKPQLAEVFCSGDQVVKFVPQGPEDVQAAEQETEYIQHLITQKNDWFSVWYNWTHDALIQKNGYVIAYWDEEEDRTKEKYQGLSEEEIQILLQDEGVKLVSVDGDIYTFERVKQYGCLRIENVPPERVLVSHNARGLDLQDRRLDFLEYWEFKTISQLRDDGFKVDDDLTDDTTSTQQWEESLRDDNNPFRNMDGEESSPAVRRLRCRNVWIRYDGDDDGRAELRRVVIVGKTILENEECDLVTLVAKCPTPLPHQHIGLSVADAVMDLQDIKTALLRGTLDNQYLANNGRFAIGDRVNLDDMLVSRPGGVVRVDGSITDQIMPLSHGNPAMESVPLMEYVDRISQKRTGVNEQSQGLDSQALSDATAYHARQLASAAMLRIKFIARVFAETGMKSLFKVAHALTLKHARKQEIVNLRNQWVPVDPRQWVKRNDMTVTLGDMDKATQMTFLESILQKQVMALQSGTGLATPDRLFNTLKRQVRLNGYKDENEFFANPQLNPPPPAGPPPELLKEQAKAQAAMTMKDMEIKANLMVAQQEHDRKMAELQAQMQLQSSNDQRDAEREILKAQYQAEIERQRLTFEEWKAQLTAELGKYTNDQDNAVKLQIAGLNADTQAQTQQLQIGHDAAQKQAERDAVRTQDMTKQEAEQLIGGTLDKVTKTMGQLAEMQKQVAEGQKALEAAIKAKRVLVRDASGRPTHSEIQQ